MVADEVKSTERDARRVWNRAALLLVALIVVVLLLRFAALVAVELETVRGLPKDFDLVIEKDRGDGSPTTMGDALVQVNDALGGVLIVDFDALGLDEATTRNRSIWGPVPATPGHYRTISTIRLDIGDMLGDTMRSHLSPDAAVVVEGEHVVVTHTDRVGFDATAKARAMWKWITSR